MKDFAIYKNATTTRANPNRGCPATAITNPNKFRTITGTINNMVYPFFKLISHNKIIRYLLSNK